MNVLSYCEVQESPGTGSGHRTMGLPAVYIGTLLGFAHLPETELYNLMAPVGEYPLGATVTRATLEQLAHRRVG